MSTSTRSGINRAREQKDHLEQEIHRAVARFEEGTGLHVTDIWTETAHGEPGTYPIRQVARVNIRTEMETR